MARTSVIIPSKNERFLTQTIINVLEQAVGEIEVLPVLDGYEPSEHVDDPRVRYLRLPPSDAAQMRHGTNLAVAQATGDWLMKLDAHCMLSKGFDEALAGSCQRDWIMIPRRVRLNAEAWCPVAPAMVADQFAGLTDEIDDRPPVDYEYWMYREFREGGLHGYKWDARTLDRLHLPIDETMHFQGSCYFMHRSWFERNGFLHTEGFTGFTQEAEELTLWTWMSGGKVMVNKNVWYAHLHKGKQYGRMYKLNWDDVRKGIAYSYNLFVNDHRAQFVDIIDRFWPLPGWPEDWKLRLPALEDAWTDSST